MLYSRVEQETIILFNEQDSECELYTCNPEIIQELLHCCKGYPQVYKLYAERYGAYTFKFPKESMKLNFIKPNRKRRNDI